MLRYTSYSTAVVHSLDKRKVIGSNPLATTNEPNVMGYLGN